MENSLAFRKTESPQNVTLLAKETNYSNTATERLVDGRARLYADVAKNKPPEYSTPFSFRV